MSYEATIGLEVHAQLNTETKMFCNSANDPDADQPNVHICPVCLGHPGTLPTVNKEAVRQVLRVGAALDGDLADYTEFDRKNYFYPDIPKGYQISQYEHPLVSGGALTDVEITRVHLEEDTATSQHKDNKSLVNFNRAGVPLMELVTEPVISSAEQAADFGRELQILLQTLSASQARMEKGEMRVEANISIAKPGADELGTKVEVKNLNSFQVVKKAIEYEIKRHTKALENGEEIIQETRGWDEDAQETFSQRKKETADDYRYFPDPDIPKLKISEIKEFQPDVLKQDLPELPGAFRERLGSYGVKAEDQETLLSRQNLKRLFNEAESNLDGNEESLQLLANYLTSDVVGLESDHGYSDHLDGKKLAKLVQMIVADKLSSRGAKDVLEVIFTDGGAPEAVAEQHDLLQKSGEDELQPVVDEIIAENPDPVKQIKDGDESVIQFLIGQGMQKTGGSANPKVLRDLLQQTINGNA